MPSWKKRAQAVEVHIAATDRATPSLARFGITAEEAARGLSRVFGGRTEQSWPCAYCGALNAPGQNRCHHCGGPR